MEDYSLSLSLHSGVSVTCNAGPKGVLRVDGSLFFLSRSTGSESFDQPSLYHIINCRPSVFEIRAAEEEDSGVQCLRCTRVDLSWPAHAARRYKTATCIGSMDPRCCIISCLVGAKRDVFTWRQLSRAASPSPLALSLSLSLGFSPLQSRVT